MTYFSRNRIAGFFGALAFLGAALGMAGQAQAQEGDCRLLDGKVWVDCPSDLPEVSFLRYGDDRQWARIAGAKLDGGAILQLDAGEYGNMWSIISPETSTRPDVGGSVRYAGDSAYMPTSGTKSIIEGTFTADFDFSQDAMTSWRSEHEDGQVFEIPGAYPLRDMDDLGVAVYAGRTNWYRVDGEWVSNRAPRQHETTTSVSLYFNQYGQSVSGTFYDWPEGSSGGAYGAFMGGMDEQDAGS